MPDSLGQNDVHDAVLSDAAVEATAAQLFGPSVDVARKYAQLLAGAGVERGIVGPAEADRVWERHVLNCAVVARLLPAKGSLVDLGSGAGLPGIVLAILLPGVRVTLLEPMARRVEFLEECLAELSLPNAEVVRGRAEDLAGLLAADVVAARAVAPLDKLAGLALGLLRPGGKVLAIKGASAEAELIRARPVLGRLGVTDARVVQAGSADGAVSATVVTFTAPAHRVPGSGGGRAAGRNGSGPGRGPGGGYPGGGKKARQPNSRRGGG
jgi:16S rRNA (guanine527-N7)-methyltransferase